MRFLAHAITSALAVAFTLAAVVIVFISICQASPKAGGVFIGIVITLAVLAVPVGFIWLLFAAFNPSGGGLTLDATGYPKYIPARPPSCPPKNKGRPLRLLLCGFGALFVIPLVFVFGCLILNSSHPIQAIITILASLAIIAGAIFGALFLAKRGLRRIIAILDRSDREAG